MAGIKKIPKRRRRENKTDYKLRLGMLKSPLRRIVIRKSNRYISIQAVESDEAKDKVIWGITSKALLSYGWDEKHSGSLKSLPAGYLTGILFAKKIDNKQKYIIDIGMARNIKGSRICSVIKGIIDGGVKIDVGKEIFPDEKKIEGEHQKKEIKEMLKKIKSKITGLKSGGKADEK